MPTRLLAIDTALNACSAALQIGSEIIERFEIAPQKQSELILPMARSLLAEAGLELTQLDAIAFGAGPGSFTGARLAASIAQGFCFGADLPGIPISTLHAVAQSTHREYRANNVLVALDAHVKEIYWGIYACGDAQKNSTPDLMQPVIKDMVCHPKNLLFAKTNFFEQAAMPAKENDKTSMPNGHVSCQWLGAGDGWNVYAEELEEQCMKNRIELAAKKPSQLSRARDIAKLALDDFLNGRFVSAEDCLPVYLLGNCLYQTKK